MADTPRSQESRWVTGFPLIAHALGSIDGAKYTNSVEALERSYRRGLRLFEADVSLTSDGVPVLIHGWTERDYARLGWSYPGELDAQLSSADFAEKAREGKVSPLTLSDLYEFMSQREDVRVLFDIRDQPATVARALYKAMREACPSDSVADRCMAGAYSTAMLQELRSGSYFDAANLYYEPTLYSEVADFADVCRDFRVQTVTVNSVARAEEVLPLLREMGVDVLVFTVNSAGEISEALDKGVAAVGTDNVSPEQVKRAGEYWIRELTSYEDARGNRIVYSGSRPPKIVTIRFRGRNNTLIVGKSSRLDRLNVLFDNDNATVTIGDSRGGIPTGLFNIRAGQDSTVTIGDDVSCTGVAFLSATEGTTVSVGNDVMFARANEIRADDAHAIFDVTTGERVNVSKSISIGNHVWLARDAVLLRGAQIGSGSVVGYRSIVTGEIPNNCIAIGAPARVTRGDIEWERPHLDDFPPYKPDASLIEVSEYWERTNFEAL